MVADDLEVQVEVDPRNLVVVGRRLEGSRRMNLVAAQEPGRIHVATEDPPLAGDRNPQLIATDDLSRTLGRALSPTTSANEPDRGAFGSRQPRRDVHRRDGLVPLPLFRSYERRRSVVRHAPSMWRWGDCSQSGGEYGRRTHSQSFHR